MANRFISVVKTAKTKYEKGDARPGYPISKWEQVCRYFQPPSQDKSVQELELKLNAANDDQANQLVVQHFKANAFQNCSFSSYLLDELMAKFPDEEWCQFNSKPLIFSQGKLYRGTGLPPQVVFNEGFIDHAPSKSLDDYASDFNGAVGISTSKDYSMAAGYAVPMAARPREENLTVELRDIGYVYEINYRGHVGIDLEQTQLARGNQLRASFARGKQEVNVVRQIRTCDIVRVWQLTRGRNTRKETANTNYQAERKNDDEDLAPALVVPSRDFFSRKPNQQAAKKQEQTQTADKTRIASLKPLSAN